MLERGVSIAGDSTSLPVTDSSPNTTEEPQTPEAETPGDHNKGIHGVKHTYTFCISTICITKGFVSF